MHFIEFYEKVQTSLKKNFMNVRDAVGLGQKYGKWRPQICRKSGKNIGLNIHRLELLCSVDTKCIIAKRTYSDSGFFEFLDKKIQVFLLSVVNIYIFARTQSSKHHESSRLDIVANNSMRMLWSQTRNSLNNNSMIVPDFYIRSPAAQKSH